MHAQTPPPSTGKKPEPFAHDALLTIYNEQTNEERSCTQAEFDETFGPAGWTIIEPVTAEQAAEAEELAVATNETNNAEGTHRARRRHRHEGD